MDARTTLEHWKSFAREHSRAGADNYFTVDGRSFLFDPNPTRYENGAIQGHIFEKRAQGGVEDLGAYKISADGSIVVMPAEVAPYLLPAPPRPIPSRTFDLNWLEEVEEVL